MSDKTARYLGHTAGRTEGEASIDGDMDLLRHG